VTLLLVLTSTLHATISISTYLADSNELIAWVDPNVPYVYPEMMAGTELTLVLESDRSGLWKGGLIAIAESYWNQGQLFARDFNEVLNNYEGSVTDLAGTRAKVSHYWGPTEGIEGEALGFSLRGDFKAVAGPWFIIDCNTYASGDCLVTMFDTDVSQSEVAFNMLFPLVPSRDYDKDHVVTFADFALFANQWREPPPTDPNQPTSPMDLDSDGVVGASDMTQFSHYWLARTRGLTESGSDPNNIEETLDVNNVARGQ
jgi:hypothetical protein